MSSSSSSSCSSSPSFTLPFHLPPNRHNPAASPGLAPLLNMPPAEQQPTHALCSKTAAGQQKQETGTRQSDSNNSWRAAAAVARQDMPAGQTIGQTGLREPDERKRRDDVAWVDWVGW